MTETPYTDGIIGGGSEPRVPDGAFLDPTWRRVLPVWWAFFWPLALTMAVTAVAGELAGDPGWGWAGPLVKFVLWSTVMFICMRNALDQSFSDFHVALVRPLQGDATPIPPTFTRVAHVTWGYMWRSWVYALILGLIVGLPVLLIAGPKVLMPSPIDGVVNIVSMGALSYYVFQSDIVNGIFGDVQIELISNS
jgi:hypothetical protein